MSLIVLLSVAEIFFKVVDVIFIVDIKLIKVVHIEDGKSIFVVTNFIKIPSLAREEIILF